MPPTMTESVTSFHADDEIRPYSVHISSKYLNLTLQKLQLTRLPHEIVLPATREWEQGTPKSAIEPLIDFWSEKYSWRDQETLINETVQQFRTGFRLPQAEAPLRVHFIHMRSSRRDAIPLLLLPAFPLANLAIIPLITALTAPTEPGQRPFHVVVPSIPGLGFSDSYAFQSPEVLKQTASIFNSLMLRLGYVYYVASNSGSGAASPDHIDYHLARLLAVHHPDNCIGLHLISPPSTAPGFFSAPIHWIKYRLASLFNASIFGYSSADFSAMTKNSRRRGSLPYIVDDGTETSKRSTGCGSSNTIPVIPVSSRYYSIGLVGLREPSTMAYALCDSPVGLLSLVISALRNVSPHRTFSNTEIINFTQLAWLPGPEAGMRFWASAVKEIHDEKTRATPCRAAVGITAFLGDEKYQPPAWSRLNHRLISSHRAPGISGLVSWDQSEAVVEGLRTFCSALEDVDPRTDLAQLDQVVTGGMTVSNKMYVDSLSSHFHRPGGLPSSSMIDLGGEAGSSVTSLPDGSYSYSGR